MVSRIPLKLTADPIIDAVIELRVETSLSLSDVLPGVLLQKLEDNEDIKIERLPHADIPKHIRERDISLQYLPLVRVVAKSFTVLMGDNVLAIACRMPYPGGSVFKEKAAELIQAMLELEIVTKIKRVSIKYVDFIRGDSNAELAKYINLKLDVGDDNYVHSQMPFSIRLENRHEDKIIQLTQMSMPVEVKLNFNNKSFVGLVIENDTIKDLEDVSLESFKDSMLSILDSIHLQNKKSFFSILTDYGCSKLGVIYA